MSKNDPILLIATLLKKKMNRKGARMFLNQLLPKERELLETFTSKLDMLTEISRKSSPPSIFPNVQHNVLKQRATDAISKICYSYGTSAMECLEQVSIDTSRKDQNRLPPLIMTILSLPKAEKVCTVIDRNIATQMLNPNTVCLRGDIAQPFYQIAGSSPVATDMYNKIINRKRESKSHWLLTSPKAVWVVNVVYWDSGPFNSDLMAQAMIIGDQIDPSIRLFPNYEDEPARFKQIIKKLAPAVYLHFEEDGDGTEFYALSQMLNSMTHSECQNFLGVLNSLRTKTDISKIDIMHSMTKRVTANLRGCSNCKKIGLKLKCCGRCKLVHYCSAECQKIDWKAGHKKTCKFKKK
jgi:hypothetical protein